MGNISGEARHPFAIQKSHYGWNNCSTAPAIPATWALLVLGLALRRRRLKSP
ncbi:MYXO-CTERM sorting domain-containing protein [Archangium sp.]|uniref:MYXO-CTERM sorting domain-containing protein n=1 Tax=Archangium sp. TaxID=1872627 RepID=UPI0039C86D32